MKITPSFGKKLVGTCQIKSSNDEAQCCKIYELTPQRDKFYFHKLKNNPNWQDNKYLGIMDGLMQSPAPSTNSRAFCIEKDNECLGYVRTQENGDKTQIDYLETCPKYQTKNKQRNTQNIGQTLLAFIITLAKKDEKEEIRIPYPAKSAIPFYKKKFNFRTEDIGTKKLILDEDKFDKALEKYNKNTGVNLELKA